MKHEAVEKNLKKEEDLIKRLRWEAEKKEHYYDMTLKQVDAEKE